MKWWRTQAGGSAAWLYFQQTPEVIQWTMANGKVVSRSITPLDQAKAVLGRSVMSPRNRLEVVDGLPAGAKRVGTATAHGAAFEYFLGPL